MSWRASKKSSAARGYGSRWQKARLTYLREHPFCLICKEQGRSEPAVIVDHIVPHKGDSSLFWDSSNWQPLCKYHHDSDKQRLEKSGYIGGCSPDGIPKDAFHHWNK